MFLLDLVFCCYSPAARLGYTIGNTYAICVFLVLLPFMKLIMSVFSDFTLPNALVRVTRCTHEFIKRMSSSLRSFRIQRQGGGGGTKHRKKPDFSEAARPLDPPSLAQCSLRIMVDGAS